MSDLPDTEYEGGWQASDTPQESWSECTNSDPDGQWPVDSVVAEELDWTGTKRYPQFNQFVRFLCIDYHWFQI